MNRTVITLLVVVVLSLVFGFVQPNFVSQRNVLTMLRTISYPGIVCVGVALCLIGGTMDLSVGATAGLSATIASSLMLDGHPIWLGVAAALASGVLVGIINATLVLKLRLTTFIATIGMMFAVRGVIYWVSKGFFIYPIPSAVREFGEARPLGVSWAFVVFMALIAIGHYALDHTVWGLCVRATGSDREVARCTEVNVDRIQTQLHIVTSILASVAGLFYMCKIGGGQPTIGTGVELTVIASCVVGGVSLFGYEGSMIAVFLGLLFTQVVTSGVITSGVNVYLQPTAQGIILVAAMVLDARESTKTLFRRTV